MTQVTREAVDDLRQKIGAFRRAIPYVSATHAEDVLEEADALLLSLQAELAEAKETQANVEFTHRLTLREVQAELMRVSEQRDVAQRELFGAQERLAVCAVQLALTKDKT